VSEPDFIERLFVFEATTPGSPEAREAQHHVLMNLHRRIAVREADERLIRMVNTTLRTVLIPVLGLALLELVRRLVS